ncbi:MAG: Fe-S oxidoreductase [Acidimicrobiia bacterium]|nr:Fe-S oxidoreductase [Acidimicrobiia bacterium]
MTTSLYDPLDDLYFDKADLKKELDQTFHQCADCRLCIKYCYSFKSLFQMVDEIHEGDSSAITQKENDRIVNECFQCKLCYTNCPYNPETDTEWNIDFPRLMLRALSIMNQDGKTTRSAKLLAKTDMQGKLVTKVAPIFNKTNEIKPVRVIIEKATGISKERLLPTFTFTKFSSWFKKRTSNITNKRDVKVALFPTCLVEYQNPDIGKAVVGVYEKNGIECTLPKGQVCCGMPHLDAGDTKSFTKNAKKNVEILSKAIDEGYDIVVPQPTCGYVLKKDYIDYLGSKDAQKVADNTYDVSEYLMKQHKISPLNKDFDGQTFDTITWHQPCHYGAQNMGPQSSLLMKLTGAKVEMTTRCSAIDGTWGLRKENVSMARKIAKPLMDFVNKKESNLVAGDCNLANTAIEEGTGRLPVHPIQVLNAAYGNEMFNGEVKATKKREEE